MDIKSQSTFTSQKSQWWMWVVFALIVLAILVGLYIYNSRQQSYGPGTATETPGTPEAKLLQQGTSDELPAIEKDVNATDLSNLDKELNNINAQLQ